MSNEADIEVLVVDDYPLVRRSVRRLLEGAATLTVVGEAGNGREALDLIEELQPDVVVMDIKMPEMDGLEVARQVQKQELAASILLLTLHNSVQTVRQALQYGVRGYVLKRFAGQELVKAVLEVARGRTFLGHGLEDDARADRNGEIG